MKIMETLLKYKNNLEKDGYTVLYLGLYGSQNYNVDDEQSDIDAKVIVLPKLDDIVFRKTVSFVKEFDEGACDVKDLITYYNVVKKGNFSFLEPFYTQCFLGDTYLRCLFKQIPVNKMSILGGMLEKRKALTHEYPSKIEEFKKFGCDPKQFSHLIRLYDLLKANTNKPYLSYNGEEAEYMLEIKRSMYGRTVDDLEKISDAKIEEARKILQDYSKYQELNLDTEVYNYLLSLLKEVLKNENQR